MTELRRDPMQCEAFQEELSELALGILTGERRSVILDHVESCQWCSTELQQLSIAADTVLQLAPEFEPTLGFEQRLAERLQGGLAVSRPRNRHRLSRLVAAAVITVFVGFGLGAVVTSNGNTPAVDQLTSASLISRGHNMGEVYISDGTQAWMFMTVDAGHWGGVVTCRLTMASGNVETIGKFKLSGGYGAWGVLLQHPASSVKRAQLIGPSGAVMASADISV